MKIKGHDSLDTTHVVDLCETRDIGLVTVRVKPLPMGVDSVMEERVPTPRPPYKVLRGPAEKVLRDDAGKPVTGLDETDPEYLKKQRHAMHLQMVAMIDMAVIEDGTLEFSAQKPAADADPAVWRAYYEALLAEWIGSGLGMGTVAALGRRIQQISGISREAIERAMEGF